MPDFPRIGSLLWRVISDALGPAQHLSVVFRWWPTIVAVLPGSLALVALGLPERLGLSAVWWIAISLGALAFLFARSAYGLHSTLNPVFPLHSLTVGKLWYADMDDPWVPDLMQRVVALPVSYVNREPVRRAILEFELLWSRSVKGQVLGPYTLSPFKGKPFLDSRLTVEPQSMIPGAGELGSVAFEATHDFIFEFGKLMEVAINSDYALTLRITERVTEAVIERPVSGESIQ